MLQDRADTVEKMIEREAIPEEHWSWLRYFSSEGFALLKLAEKIGFKTSKNYLHVHDALRKSPSFKFNYDSWRIVNYKL